MVITYLGFDVGTKRTGVAIANSLTKQAHGIKTITHNKNGATNWSAIEAILDEHNPQVLIVGLPFNKGFEVQEMTNIARSFAKKLEQKYGIKTVLVDEYLSSNEARKQLKYHHNHPNAKRDEVDKRAAEIILQTWLNDKN